ncbi:right-handed parallel beta-helix repeat-containing protein [Hymenobacter sp. 5516J-16]|uniref:right-handed parallel beta-helix repeat-containing protein n=1 Tax=Hymenobacter sp. 5516J-16 TaxID=2932253 RepID=UPI001FD2F5EE|nr:right-handed parallel beta-helix repeat-containing protein [Hymenobacter sp. 5516J-16]UOQ77692.1 right-handed parallel beta-helix repeat-containing protein [Hymenobacter sp. 5516J-16]
MLGSPEARASTYYISPAGNDGAAGTTATTAWQTLARVNVARFQPGDRILFQAGATFTGSLWLQSAGSVAAPLVVSSYGRGVATINSGTDYGFYAPDVAGIELRRLRFVGSGRLTNTNSGVIFTTAVPNARLRHLVLDSLDVSGYLKAGIILGSSSPSSGYDDVRITNCQAHANGEAGISSYSYYPQLSHNNWYVSNCRAYDNSGRQDVTTTHTGNGIVLAGIDGVVVERCEAYNNGWLNSNPGGGPVGIWGWLCNNLVIQDCESHHNRSGLAHDGGGFDLDGGCTNSVLQYNYSHDNDGAGYLLAQFDGAPPMHDLTIRYNISENDARRYGQGAIMLWSSGANGGIQRAAIHNNTVYVTPATDNSQAKAFYLSSGGVSGITVRNNIFQTTTGVRQVQVLSTANLQFQGNCYWGGPDAPLSVAWGGATFTSLSSWQGATGQEMIGTRAVGLNQAPNFVSPGAGGTLNSTSSKRMQSSWDAYKLQAGSSVIGQGLDLVSEFNLWPGLRDFFGSATPAQGVAGNIGAVEASSSAAPLPVGLASFTALRQREAVLLRWTTLWESANAYFEVQVSSDGASFRRAGTVAGRGTTTAQTSYRWLDEKQPSQATTLYYRLKQVDLGGKETYTPVVKVAPAATETGLVLQAWPNPFAEVVHLQIQSPAAGQARITCTDALGRAVLTRTLEVAKGAALLALSEVSQLPRAYTAYGCSKAATRLPLK